MSEADLLARLTPPPGGWQRLQARRDAGSRWSRLALGLPLATSGAAAAAVALVLLSVLRIDSEVRMPWIGARLIAQRSDGPTLTLLAAERATIQPSDDPRVRFYWVQSGAGEQR